MSGYNEFTEQREQAARTAHINAMETALRRAKNYNYTCEHAWGHCTGKLETAVAFGQPSSTPHRCKSGKRHIVKLHVCALCDVVGAVSKPLPFTKAGRLYAKMLRHHLAQQQSEMQVGTYLQPRARVVKRAVKAISPVAVLLFVLFATALYGQATAKPQGKYRQHGPAQLNDLAVTPGAVRPDATVAQLCAASFHTGAVRNVTEATKQAACAEYGLARAQCVGTNVEIDHLISLELGGSNDLRNLWPQPYSPRPGAKEKDVVENWLHRQVCSNKMTLPDSQHAIATDWYAVYLQVPKANGGGGQ